MATLTRISANRTNGSKSRGPVTATGKAASSKNATRHGIFVSSPVLPIVEDASQWEAHRRAIVDNIAPVGAMEEALAERVAVLLWRLQRVIRFEREDSANALEKAEPFFGYDPEASDTSGEEQWVAILKRFPALPPATKLPADEASTILYFVDPKIEFSEESQTVAAIHALIEKVAVTRATTNAALLARAIEKAEAGVAKSKSKAVEQEEKLRAHRGRHLIPAPHITALVMKYESHLERSLHKTLHQIERFQALRAGLHVPAPVVVDVTVSGDDADSKD